MDRFAKEREGFQNRRGCDGHQGWCRQNESNALHWGQGCSGLEGGKHLYVAVRIAKTSAGAAPVGTGKEKLSGEPEQGWAARCHLPMPFPLAPFLPAQKNRMFRLTQARKQHKGLAAWYHNKAGESKQQQGAYHELIFVFAAHCCQLDFTH